MIRAARRLTERTQRISSETLSRLRRRTSETVVAFVLLMTVLALTPATYAASPFGKAVFFLDAFGAHLSSFESPNSTLARAQGKKEVGAREVLMATRSEKDKETDLSATQLVPQAQAADSRTEVVRYVVEEGDTLSRIAQDFDISVATLMTSNALTSRSVLRPGQELTILPVDGVQHTVRRGETVSHIAHWYDTDVDEIITFNNIHSEGLIQPGQKIIVPGAGASGGTTASLATTQQSQPAVSATPIKNAPAPAPQVDMSGYFIFPVTGRVTQGLHFLNAVDMGGSAYCGTPVKAAAGGTILTVTNAGWNGGYGNYVKISHPNGTETIYAHNARNIVSRGQQVAQGEVIGYMGSTGNSTGCHVHFAVRGGSNPSR